MKLLLTFTGFRDPYAESVLDGSRQPGPILSMVEAGGFESVVLFGTPGARRSTEATLDALANAWPRVGVEVKDLAELHDPTDHILILRYLRRFAREILSDYQGAQVYIAISSGTPSMHACWLLLVADGSLPAKILHGYRPRDSEDSYRLKEVDLSASEFPDIQPREHYLDDSEAVYVPKLGDVCEELGIVGDDKRFADALDQAARLAPFSCHVLVTGETGTGKEQLARLAHLL